ncbi:MAG TPA: IclR family transcriptional regulator [Xanthobacteraceae bacterium]|nr:IclR family transcriptional regulator [Xanthobacteraceae bacterium]
MNWRALPLSTAAMVLSFVPAPQFHLVELVRRRYSAAMTSPGRAPLNRSLTRGIAILRAFRPGTELLGNGELAERTGLPRASISRLTQTLTGAGYLEYDARERAYRLGAPVLTLGHAMRSGSSILRIAAPMMTALARRLHINVGLAVRDGDDMVYLESVRCDARGAQRSVVYGQRVPIELTALGRAWLAAAPEPERKALMARWRVRRRKHWRLLRREITAAIERVKRDGYCMASWQPQVIALAAPLVMAPRPVHVVNVSVTTKASLASVVHSLEQPLRTLAAEIQRAIGESESQMRFGS